MNREALTIAKEVSMESVEFFGHMPRNGIALLYRKFFFLKKIPLLNK